MEIKPSVSSLPPTGLDAAVETKKTAETKAEKRTEQRDLQMPDAPLRREGAAPVVVATPLAAELIARANQLATAARAITPPETSIARHAEWDFAALAVPQSLPLVDIADVPTALASGDGATFVVMETQGEAARAAKAALTGDERAAVLRFSDAVADAFTDAESMRADMRAVAKGEVAVPSPVFTKVESAYRAVATDLSNVDIEQLAMIVLFELAAEHDRDLRQVLADMRAATNRKAALRAYASNAKAARARLVDELRSEYKMRTGLDPTSELYIDETKWSFEQYQAERGLYSNLATPAEVAAGGVGDPELALTDDFPIQPKTPPPVVPVAPVTPATPAVPTGENVGVVTATDPSATGAPAEVTSVAKPSADPKLGEAEALLAAHQNGSPPLDMDYATKLVDAAHKYGLTPESMYCIEHVRVEGQKMMTLPNASAIGCCADLDVFMTAAPPLGLSLAGKTPAEIKEALQGYIDRVKTYPTAQLTPEQTARAEELYRDQFALIWAVERYQTQNMGSYPLPPELSEALNTATTKVNDFLATLGPVALQAVPAVQTLAKFDTQAQQAAAGLPSTLMDDVVAAIARNSRFSATEAQANIASKTTAWSALQLDASTKAYCKEFVAKHSMQKWNNSQSVPYMQNLGDELVNAGRVRDQLCRNITPWPFTTGDFTLTIAKTGGGAGAIGIPALAITKDHSLAAKVIGKTLRQTGAARTLDTFAGLDAKIQDINDQMTTESDMNEEMSLRVQMAMDARQKAYTMLSNMLRKIAETADSITRNLK